MIFSLLFLKVFQKTHPPKNHSFLEVSFLLYMCRKGRKRLQLGGGGGGWISPLFFPIVGERVCCSSSSIIGFEISRGLSRISKGFLEDSGIGRVELPSPMAFPAVGVPSPFDDPFPLDILLSIDRAAF
jgi:hypothetical protein